MIVVDAISPVLFRVTNRKRTFVLHHNRLKPCQDRDLPLWINCKRNAILKDLDNMEYPEDWHGDDLRQLFEENDSQEVSQESTDKQDPADFGDVCEDEEITDDTVGEEVKDCDNVLEDDHPPKNQLPPTRAGFERRHPHHLDDYSL